MNSYKNIFRLSYMLIAGIALLNACQPEHGGTLGNPPKADFSSSVNSNGYTVLLVNKSSGPGIAYWAIPSINLGFSDLRGDSIKLNITFPGTYEVKMRVFGQGGVDSVKQNITTTQPNPDACKSTSALGFIASCTVKTWKLLPDAGAYKVGPGPDDGSWWSNGAGDVPARSCEFDDEYKFTFNSAGTFTYNSHGDFFGDGYMGDNTSSCQAESNFTTTQKPWGSGTFSYSVIPGGGVNHLGQLKLIGLGAHMGLQKVTTTGEIPSGPVSSITYDILSMTPNAGGDILVIGVNYAPGSWWTFTFKSF